MLLSLYLVLVVIAGALLMAALRPSQFRVERTVLIEAPPEKIFPHLNDFHAWLPWSPWEKIDPNVKRTFTGAAQGAGAHYAWAGNRQLGEGEMFMRESIPPSTIKIDIHFIKPFAAQNKIEFTLTPEGRSTRVTQSMMGENKFLSKVMSLFFSMEKMVGGKFAQGLAGLKLIAENQ